MKLTFVTLFIFILSSCVSIYFTEPQPKGGVLLNEMPEELHGHWHLDHSELIIEEKGIISYRTRHRDSISNTLDTLYENLILGDTVHLYKVKNLYVLNYRENNRPWEIAILEKHRNGNIYTYGSIDPELFSKDKNLKLDKAHFTIDKKDTTVYTLNPDFDYTRELNSATFSGQMTFETIRKIAKKENIFHILKKDGSVEMPQSQKE